MNPSAKPLLVIVVCLIAAVAGYLIFDARHGSERPVVSESAVNSALPAAGAVPAPGGGASDTAPKVHFTDLDGKTHTLDEYRGKLLVVNFWATWCGPCLHEIPALIKIQSDYAAKGFTLVGPAVDDPETVKAQARGLGFNYPVFVGESDAMIDLMAKLGNTAGALPFSVVIGADGRIVHRQLGEFAGAELLGIVEKNLPTTP